MGGNEPVLFFVTENIITDDFERTIRCYDIKGGDIDGRRTELSEDDRERSGLKVLKDLNYIELKEHVFLEPTLKEQVLAVLDRDTQFLQSFDFMDYSLFLVIVDLQEQHRDTFKSSSLVFDLETREFQSKDVTVNLPDYGLKDA